MPRPCAGRGGGDRVDLARVVGAVGDQHDHPGLGRAVLEASGGVRQRHADGGAVRQAVELDRVDEQAEHVAVGGQRRPGHGRAGEDRQADAVAGAPGDEVAHDLLGHGEPVAGLEVLGAHAARDVEHDLDVDPLGEALLPGIAELRAGERGDQAAEGEEARIERQVEAPGTAASPEARRKPAVGERAERRPAVVAARRSGGAARAAGATAGRRRAGRCG